MTIANEEIGLARPFDIQGMIDLQGQNLPARNGKLSVEFTRKVFEAAMADMPVIVARRECCVIGYVLSSSLAANMHIPIIQAMIHVYPLPSGTYIYGPICVAASERGRGLAGRLFEALRARLPGRQGVTFIRRDNIVSLRAHVRIGMHEVAEFAYDEVVHAVFVYDG